MKKVIVMLLSASALLSLGVACDRNKASAPNDEKALYAMGVVFGQRVRNLNLNKNEVDTLFKGFRAGALGEKEQVKMEEAQGFVQDFMSRKMADNAKGEEKSGADFMDKFVKEGGMKTASGLGYKIISAGTGKQPKPTDIVKVHYHGTLTDGTVFDSSKDRGQPAEFPLSRVIKGWTEGVQLIREGGKITLVVPPELGYGVQGAPPKIPGGATLVFNIELLSVGTPAAPPETHKKKK